MLPCLDSKSASIKLLLAIVTAYKTLIVLGSSVSTALLLILYLFKNLRFGFCRPDSSALFEISLKPLISDKH